MKSIMLQIRNYRKPAVQWLIMVPLYAISSLVSLFSVEAAFVIDAIRDIYEAFVIYCFFGLLRSWYLGGERSLLILLQGRPPRPVFPINLFKREIDPSDPPIYILVLETGYPSLCSSQASLSSSNTHSQIWREIQRRRFSS